MSSVQTSAWPTCVSSENYHLWTLALNFCHILPDDESGRNGKCRWQLPLANWQHSAKYITGTGLAAGEPQLGDLEARTEGRSASRRVVRARARSERVALT